MDSDAALIASEYISSLDNVPSEVQHILAEIKHRDAKSAELRERIAKRDEALLRAAAKAGGTSAPVDEGKELTAQGKIRADWEKLEKCAREKEEWAGRLEILLAKHLRRLAEDLRRIEDAAPSTGPPPGITTPLSVSTGGLSTPLGLAASGQAGTPLPLMSLAAVERERSAGAAVLDALQRAGTPDEARSNKKRKLNPPPPAAAAAAPTASRHPLSRLGSPAGSPASSGAPPTPLSGPGGPRRRAGGGRLPASSEDDDAEGDAEEGGGNHAPDGEEDNNLYCFCQRKSFGEMIGCDSDTCRFEWFHVGCVGVKPPLPETWYCTECRTKMAIGAIPTPTAGGGGGRTKNAGAGGGGGGARKKK